MAVCRGRTVPGQVRMGAGEVALIHVCKRLIVTLNVLMCIYRYIIMSIYKHVKSQKLKLQEWNIVMTHNNEFIVITNAYINNVIKFL